MKTTQEVKARLMQDPKVRQEYEAQEEEFEALLKEIMNRTSASRAYLCEAGD